MRRLRKTPQLDEAAVLAKLREQEPVGWYDTENHDYSRVNRVGWTPLYAHPLPPSDVVQDAERYQFIRDNPWDETDLEWVIKGHCNALWDTAIDAAMKESK